MSKQSKEIARLAEYCRKKMSETCHSCNCQLVWRGKNGMEYGNPVRKDDVEAAINAHRAGITVTLRDMNGSRPIPDIEKFFDMLLDMVKKI